MLDDITATGGRQDVAKPGVVCTSARSGLVTLQLLGIEGKYCHAGVLKAVIVMAVARNGLDAFSARQTFPIIQRAPFRRR